MRKWKKGPNQKVSDWSRNWAMANNIDCLITKQNTLYLIPPKLEFRLKKKQMTTELFKNSSNSHRNFLLLCVFSVSPIKILQEFWPKKNRWPSNYSKIFFRFPSEFLSKKVTSSHDKVNIPSRLTQQECCSKVFRAQYKEYILGFQAEIGHYNFRAETELTIKNLFAYEKKNHSRDIRA